MVCELCKLVSVPCACTMKVMHQSAQGGSFLLLSDAVSMQVLGSNLARDYMGVRKGQWKRKWKLQ